MFLFFEREGRTYVSRTEMRFVDRYELVNVHAALVKALAGPTPRSMWDADIFGVVHARVSLEKNGTPQTLTS